MWVVAVEIARGEVNQDQTWSDTKKRSGIRYTAVLTMTNQVYTDVCGIASLSGTIKVGIPFGPL